MNCLKLVILFGVLLTTLDFILYEVGYVLLLATISIGLIGAILLTISLFIEKLGGKKQVNVYRIHQSNYLFLIACVFYLTTLTYLVLNVLGLSIVIASTPLMIYSNFLLGITSVYAFTSVSEVSNPVFHSTDKNSFPKATSTKVKVAKCYLCGQNLSKDLKCNRCGQQCEICKRAIKQGEDWTTCAAKHADACLKAFHTKEYLEWIKTHGRCPYCKQLVDESQYQISKDAAQKVAIFTAQSLNINTDNENEYRSMQNKALDVMIVLTKLSDQLGSVETKLSKMELSAFDRHNELVKIVTPVAQELELIREASERIDANMLTESKLQETLKIINSKFDSIEENTEILVEAHRKNNSHKERIKQGLAGKSGEMVLENGIKKTGIQNDLINYSTSPSVGLMTTILSKIKNGLRSTSSPRNWLKIASLVLVI